MASPSFSQPRASVLPFGHEKTEPATRTDSRAIGSGTAWIQTRRKVYIRDANARIPMCMLQICGRLTNYTVRNLVQSVRFCSHLCGEAVHQSKIRRNGGIAFLRTFAMKTYLSEQNGSWGLDGFCDWPCQWSWLFLAPETWGFSLQHVVAPSASWQSPAIPAASNPLLYTTTTYDYYKCSFLTQNLSPLLVLLDAMLDPRLGDSWGANGTSSWAENQTLWTKFLPVERILSLNELRVLQKRQNARSC